MVYKNRKKKINRFQTRKMIFACILLIYCAGLAAGCTYAAKNNFNIGSMLSGSLYKSYRIMDKSQVFDYCASFFVRDILCICSVTVFKYSGILKGFSIGVPFIFSVQNAGIYTMLLHRRQTGIFQLIFIYILKDSAITFLLLMLCYVTVNEIIQNRYNAQRDVKVLSVYCLGVLFIYIIDFAVKILIFPLQSRLV